MKLGNIPLKKKNFHYYSSLSKLEKSSLKKHGTVQQTGGNISYNAALYRPLKNLMNHYFEQLEIMMNKKTKPVGIEFKPDNYSINAFDILLFGNVGNLEDSYFHDYYFLNLMIKGSGNLIFDGRFDPKIVAMNPGDVILFDPLVTHRFEKISDDKFCVMYALNVFKPI